MLTRHQQRCSCNRIIHHVVRKLSSTHRNAFVVCHNCRMISCIPVFFKVCRNYRTFFGRLRRPNLQNFNYIFFSQRRNFIGEMVEINEKCRLGRRRRKFLQVFIFVYDFSYFFIQFDGFSRISVNYWLISLIIMWNLIMYCYLVTLVFAMWRRETAAQPSIWVELFK